jgi:uncharacterized protein YciI
MVAWAEYKSAAQARGSLALELYVVVSTPVKPPEAIKAVLAAHLAYQGEQEQGGTLAFAGPLSDRSGEQMEGVGIIIYRAASLEDARQIADDDPMHKTKTRDYTLRRWLVNEGSLQLDIKLSAQSVRI